jgi:hypothetical protein
MNASNNQYLVGDIQVHADFIERNHDLDYFACFTNTQLTKYKKWEVLSPRQTFKIWFTDMEGNPFPVKTKAEAEVEQRRQEMRLAYEKQMRGGVEAPETEPNESVTIEDLIEDTKPYISSFVLELLLIY